MIVDNEADFLLRINVFEGQGLEYKPKCLDVEDGVEDRRSQLKEKTAFHLSEVVTVLEDLCPSRQKKNYSDGKCSI